MAKISIKVSAQSEGVYTEARTGNHQVIIDEPVAAGGQDRGPNPLQLVLSALAGCESIIANMVAKEIDFDLQGIEFEIHGEVDLRGLKGDPSVRPYFETVTINAKVKTDETPERVQELQEKTDVRCPVYTMLDAAGVDIQTSWVKAKQG
ncbi:OsmC family protein [Paenibacillus xerothermodurans]|uniref:OsmC family peroxiredoxin n=1 Tax=Paenibacillus xerothermodurans TaxID=1977292 RepID=A0A2W1NV35_PAEXE|nr:OsmC family protein [Paenibacillus xerothermodurans]PZE21626.1 OsmC family peroxiredoxin [Paenibacillus xerothermodurans]